MKHGKTIILAIILAGLLVIGAASAADIASENNATGAESDSALSATNDNLKISENNNSLATGPKTFTDLNNSINGNSNKTIDLYDDYTYNDGTDSAFKGGIVISREVNIDGHGITIKGSDTARIFIITTNDKITFKNITFTGGFCKGFNDCGGAIYSDYNSHTVINCTFSDNYAEFGGGAMSDGTAIGCTFLANSLMSSSANGGAIYGVGNKGNTAGSTFINNRVTSSADVDVWISKTVNISKVNVSDRIKFIITVTNDGPSNATGVNVTEILDSHLKLINNYTDHGYYNLTGGYWYIGDLANGASANLTIIAEVNSAGVIPNFVRVESAEPDRNMSNNNCTCENVIALPIVDVGINKTVNGTTIILNGVNVTRVNVYDMLKFTITVTNYGPSNATMVNVTEVLDSHLKLVGNYTDYGYYNLTGGYWYIGDLANGTNATLTILARVINDGYFENRVTVTRFENDTNPSNEEDYVTISAQAVVDVKVNKTVNVKVANVTDRITYTIIVHNNGPSDAHWVNVYDILDSHLSLIEYNASVGDYVDSIWYVGDLPNGTSENLTIVAEINSAGVIPNFVRVTSDEPDTNMSNNNYTCENVTASNIVDLMINKTVNVKSPFVNVSDIIQFTIYVKNNGPCDATNVTVVDVLDSHLKMLDYSTWGSDYNVTTDIWYISDLAKDDWRELFIMAQVISAGTISNVVVVNSTEKDTNETNNRDNIASITALPVVDLVINKTVNVIGNVVYFGDTIIFNITVVNNGLCHATNVNVTEVLDSHLEFVDYHTWDSYYDVDAGVWYIGDLAKDDWRQLVIKARVIALGNITNVVSVISYENDTNKSNNNASIPNITAKPIVDLQIKKDVNFTGDVINVTDYIKFTITVFNDGPCNATNVNVTEVLSPHLKLVKYDTEYGYYNLTGGYWYIGRLNNQSTAVLTIYAQVISGGTISNGVIVNSIEKDSNLSNNWDNIYDITAVIVFDLQIKKEVNVSRDVDATETIEYTITVHNAGPCNATDVNVSEPLSNNLIMDSWDSGSVGWYDEYTWFIGNLNNGSTVTLTIVAKIAYGGIIENNVNVTGRGIDTNLSNNKDNVTLNATAHVDLQIFKLYTGKQEVNVTDEVIFYIIAYNDGPNNATGVYVLEALDFTHLSSNYTYVATEGTSYDGYTWHIGRLDSKRRAQLTIFSRVIAPGNFSNYVEIHGYDNDTDPSNNKDSIPNITAKPIVDLAIEKEVNVTGVVYYNDTIKFTITVTNNGPCDATYVNVTEDLDSHLKLVKWDGDGYYDVDEGVWYIGDLAKDDWRQLVIEARVIALGNITNVVSVTSYENDTNKSNNNASIPNITAKPIVDLQIKKDVNFTGDVINVTDYIKFTITVYNDGPCNATNVNVSEVLSSHLKLIKNETEFGYYDVDAGVWYVGNLTNKSSAVLTLYAQVISNGTISNVVIVNSTEEDLDPSNNKDEIDNITAVYIVDLQIKKEVNVSSTNIDITDVLKFTITVHNAGPCNATGVYVNEPLSDILMPISITPSQGYYDGKYWIIDNMTSGSTVTLTIVAKIAHEGIIENVVNVTGREIDRNLSNNKANVTLNATIHVNLGISKGDNLKTRVVNVSDLVEFTVIAYNSGPCNATGVYVIEELDSHLKLESCVAPRGTLYNGHTWYIGNLNKGEVLVLRIVARVIAPGNFSNYVEIHGYDKDTDLSNNNASIPNITAKPIVDLAIEKEVNVTGVVYYNDTIKFTITVTNNGPCDANYVNVTEVLDSHLEFVSYDGYTYYDVDEGEWYIGNVANNEWVQLEIVARVIELGNITNTVSVICYENDINKSNNNASIKNIAVEPIVDLQIKKESNASSTNVDVNDIIKYTITVRNAGPCNATDVYVCEPLSDTLKMINWDTGGIGEYDGYTWYIGDLNNGSAATLTIHAIISHGGIIDNRVNVTGSEIDTNLSNNEANVTLNATAHVDLAVIKTVSRDVVNVSDLVEFTVVAYNYGPCNATDVYVLEDLDFTYLSGNYTYVATEGTTYDGHTWYIGHLDKGANATLKIVARTIKGGNFTNYAEIFASENDTNQSNNNARVKVIINKTNSILNVGNVELDYGETTEVNVTFEGAVGVTAELDGEEIIFSGNSIPIPVLNAGTYNLTVITVPDDNHISVNKTVTVTVNRIDSTLTVGNVVFDYGGFGLASVSFSGASCVNASVVGQPGAVVKVEGNVINVSGLNAGNYTLSVATVVDDNHNSVSGSAVITVNRVDSSLSVDGVELGYGDTGNVSVTFDGAVGVTAKLNDEEIIFSGNNIPIPVLDVGIYNLTVTTIPDGNHVSVNETVTVNVSKVDSSLSVDDVELYYGETTKVNVTFDGALGVTAELDGEEIIFSGNSIPIPVLNAGAYNLTVTTIPDDNHISVNKTVTVTVLKLNTTADIVMPTNMTVGENSTVNVKLPGDATGNVTLKVDGNEIETVPVADGSANLTLPGLSAGNHTVEIAYSGDDKYNPVTETEEVNISKQNATADVTVPTDIAVGEDSNVNVKLPIDATGNITIKVDGETVNTVPVTNGTANVSLPSLKAGNHTIEITYSGDDKYNPVTQTKEISVFKHDTAPEIAVDDETVNVKLPSDATGNVTVKVDGETVSTAPVTDGTASVKLPKLSAGNHTVEISYSGDDKYNPSTETTTVTADKDTTILTAKNVTATYNVNKYLTITLTDSTGSPIANATVTVKFKLAKNYTTNSKGQIKVKVSKLVPKTYIAEITFKGNDKYAGSSATAKVKVKKAAPKLIARNKTVKTTDKIKKYTVTLKNNKGKAIKKAKVSLRVNGKTYKAKTNSKGKATFNLKKLKEKGTYKAVIKYKGNKYYKKLTKKSKITVKQVWKTVSKGSPLKHTVEEIQNALKAKGYYLSYNDHYLMVDGIYDIYTEAAVEQFQNDNGLKATGKVDEKTAKKLKLI